VSDQQVAWEGGCRCGQVRLSISQKPVITMACHCTGCQKMSASAFSLSALIPASGFAIMQGEPVIGGLHGEARHYFCPHCMSWMFTRPAGTDAFVNLRASMLDDSSRYVPFMETWTLEKLAWATTPAVRSFERLPEPNEFGELLQAYAQFTGS